MNLQLKKLDQLPKWRQKGHFCIRATLKITTKSGVTRQQSISGLFLKIVIKYDQVTFPVILNSIKTFQPDFIIVDQQSSKFRFKPYKRQFWVLRPDWDHSVMVLLPSVVADSGIHSTSWIGPYSTFRSVQKLLWVVFSSKTRLLLSSTLCPRT